MPKFQILGRVLPDPLKVTIPSRDIHWIDGNGVEANFKIRIAGSLINIECEPLNAISDNIALLIIRAFDLARASVNLVAFATAQGLSVSFDFVIGEDGTPQYLVPNDLPLASLCTAYHIEIAEEVSKMYEIIVGDVDLSRALNELILSISTPHVSPLNCGRAMDRIKHIISGNIRDDKKAWKMMRDALQIDEPYIRFIMTNSTDPRHGRPGHITPDVTNEICRRSWIIMNRFLEYKKRNATPLPIGDFPLLTH